MMFILALLLLLLLLPQAVLAAAPAPGPLDGLSWFDKDTIALADQYPQLASDALHYLVSCDLYSGSKNEACRLHENSFIGDYIHGFLGSIEARRNVASDLAVDPMTEAARFTPLSIGFTGNGIEACAWRLAIAGSGAPRVNHLDIDSANEACSPLRKGAQIAAVARVKVLLAAWQAYAKHECPH